MKMLLSTNGLILLRLKMEYITIMENIPRGLAHPFCWLNEKRHYLFLVLFFASFSVIFPFSLIRFVFESIWKLVKENIIEIESSYFHDIIFPQFLLEIYFHTYIAKFFHHTDYWWIFTLFEDLLRKYLEKFWDFSVFCSLKPRTNILPSLS